MRGFLSNKLQPDVVAHSLVRVEDEWRAQAAAFITCTEADGNISSGCSTSPAAFRKSCGKVVSAVLQASSGERSAVKEYLDDVCNQKELQGWRHDRCKSLKVVLTSSMSPDSYDNRESLNPEAVCGKFWSDFTAKEQARMQQEREATEAEERKEAQEAAEESKKATEEAAAEAEKQKEASPAEEQVVDQEEQEVKNATVLANSTNQNVTSNASKPQNETMPILNVQIPMNATGSSSSGQGFAVNASIDNTTKAESQMPTLNAKAVLNGTDMSAAQQNKTARQQNTSMNGK